MPPAVPRAHQAPRRMGRVSPPPCARRAVRREPSPSHGRPTRRARNRKAGFCFIDAVARESLGAGPMGGRGGLATGRGGRLRVFDRVHVPSGRVGRRAICVAFAMGSWGWMGDMDDCAIFGSRGVWEEYIAGTSRLMSVLRPAHHTTNLPHLHDSHPHLYNPTTTTNERGQIREGQVSDGPAVVMPSWSPVRLRARRPLGV